MARLKLVVIPGMPATESLDPVVCRFEDILVALDPCV